MTAISVTPPTEKTRLLPQLRLRGRLVLGFAALILIAAAVVGTSLVKLRSLSAEMHELNQVRIVSVDRLNDIRIEANATMEHMLGYIALGTAKGVEHWGQSWDHINGLKTQVDRLVPAWNDARQADTWQALRTRLDDLRAAQTEVQKLAATGDRDGALALWDARVLPAEAKVLDLMEGVEDTRTGLRNGGLYDQRSQAQYATGTGVVEIAEGLVTIQLALLAGAIVAGIGIALATGRAITGPLTGLQGIVTRIANGETRLVIDSATRKDEIGDLARTIGAIRDQSAANARIKAALDGVTANCMVADANGKIIYLNRTVVEMFRRAESDIRKDLPHFDANHLMGSNFDSFHRDPSHQRNLLARLTNTFRSRIKIGGRSFDLIANPVVDEAGERLGTVVEWKDITAELRVEEEIAAIVQSAADGDLTRRIALDGKEGFHRRLAEGVNDLTGAMASAIDAISGFLDALSKGDLSRRIDGDYKGMFARIRDDANGSAERLTEIVTSIVESSTAIAAAAGEISAGANDLSARTEQQASNLEETAASMEELASTVRQNSENAQQANQLAAASRESAETGGRVATEAIQAMERIEASSQRISDIIGVIDEIAFQTNLLALNAAVEAARAGDAGKASPWWPGKCGRWPSVPPNPLARSNR